MIRSTGIALLALIASVSIQADSDLAFIARQKAMGYLENRCCGYVPVLVHNSPDNFRQTTTHPISGYLQIQQEFRADADRSKAKRGNYSFTNKNGKYLNWGTFNRENVILARISGGNHIYKETRNISVHIDKTSIANLKVWHFRPTVIGIKPADNSKIADNTPDFYWNTWSNNVTVELSTSPDFPPDKTQEFEVEDSLSMTLQTPLPPGKYFWRVRTCDGMLSSISSFTQTAPQDKNCNAPVLEAVPSFTANAQAPYVFSFRSNGGKAVSGTAFYEGKVLPVTISGDSATVSPGKDGWTHGVKKMRLEITDGDGNVGCSEVYFNYSPLVPNIDWTKNNGIAINGKPFFPVGLYNVARSDFDEAQSLGINLVQKYRNDAALNSPAEMSIFKRELVFCDLTPELNQALQGIADETELYLREAERRDLKAMISFNRGMLKTQNFDYIAKKIERFQDFGNLIGWYLFDEPEVYFMQNVELRRVYEFIKALNPSRPVMLTFCSDSGIAGYDSFYDIYMAQGYYGGVKHIAQQFKAAKNAMLQRQRHNLNIISVENVKDEAQTGKISDALVAMMYSPGVFHWYWKGGKRNLSERKAYFEALKPFLPVFSAPGEGVLTTENGVFTFEKKMPEGTAFIAVNAGTSDMQIKGRTLKPKENMMIVTPSEPASSPVAR